MKNLIFILTLIGLFLTTILSAQYHEMFGKSAYQIKNYQETKYPSDLVWIDDVGDVITKGNGLTTVYQFNGTSRLQIITIVFNLTSVYEIYMRRVIDTQVYMGQFEEDGITYQRYVSGDETIAYFFKYADGNNALPKLLIVEN